jgi:kinesin family protein 2/24
MSRGPQSRNVADYHDEFVKEVEKATRASAKLSSSTSSSSSVAVAVESGTEASADAPPLPLPPVVNVLDAKVRNAFNGLETSTFTVCSRIRPVLPMDHAGTGENFKCIIPAAVKTTGNKDHCEPTLILTPKVSLMGKAKLEALSLDFDYTFGPEVSREAMFERVGAPLVQRCLAGQVGVVFAYGQTGSGKTHTMNGVMDGIAESLYDVSQMDGQRTITFSYLEILGQSITDCLDVSAEAADGGVKVGEMLDGRVETRNLVHVQCGTAGELRAQVELAKSRRATESTERNATSSRSHGVGIVTVSPVLAPQKAAAAAGAEGVQTLPQQPTAGRLYIIDLAGSERMDDKKNHTDSRLEETKAINLSLMSLKECIRARTMAGLGDGITEVHVPYRRSKLTLLMKDVFDISCRRLCSTVVLAHVSPIARDVKHSTSTLQYAAPLRVSVRSKPKGSKYETDSRDPANWSHEQVNEWILRTASAAEGIVTAQSLLSPTEGGITLCMMPEGEIYRRVDVAFSAVATTAPAIASSQVASLLYNDLWTHICDAKVRRRRPDGTLITAEDEAAEKEEAARKLKEKAELWAEREAHMKSDLIGYDGKPVN